MPRGVIRNTNNYCAGLRDKLSSIPPWLFGVFREPIAAHGGEHEPEFRTALSAFVRVRAGSEEGSRQPAPSAARWG